MMTIKERLHQIVEALPEPEAERILEQLQPPADNGDAAQANGSEPSVDMAALTAFFDEIVTQAPEEDVNRVPTDLSENLDHYIYGTPKR